MTKERILSSEYVIIDRIDTKSWDPRQKPESQTQKDKAEKEYENLVNSISAVGIRNPISVIDDPDSDVLIMIDGRRRLRAAKQLQMQEVPITRNFDLSTETKRRLVSGLANFMRSDADIKGEAVWVAAIYEAQGYKDIEQLSKDVKIIDNWFSQGEGRTWTDLESFNGTGSVKNRDPRGAKTNPILYNRDFIILCRMIGISPKYQYQLLTTLYKLDKSVRKKAEKNDLSTHKQILLTKSPLPEHPIIQKELIEDIRDMSKPRAQQRINQAVEDLRSGYIKKHGNTYVIGNQRPEKDKILPPTDTRIMDIMDAIGRYLFEMTDRAITKGEHKYSEAMINATKNFRLEILKTLSERNAIMLLENLRLIKLVTDETIKMTESELETIDKKREMLTK